MTPAVRTYRLISRKFARDGVTMGQIFSDERNKKVVEARHHAMHFLWKNKGWSQERIGRLFDRDHTTVRYACLKIEGSGGMGER